MSAFRLKPIERNLRHSDWRRSDYRDECHVFADTEAEARALAAAAFWSPREAVDPAYDPWAKEELVECVAEAKLPPAPQPKGMILAADGRVLAEPFAPIGA